MKLITLIIFLIITEAIITRRILDGEKGNNKKHKNVEKTKENKEKPIRISKKNQNNLVYKLVMGFAYKLLPPNQLFLNSCFKEVKGWKNKGIEELTKGELTNQLNKQFSQTFGQLKEHLIEEDIDAICNFKEEITNFLVKKRRRYQRRFIENSRNAHDITGMWKAIEHKCEGYANAVVAGKSKANTTIIKSGKWIGKPVAELNKFVSESIIKHLQPLLNIFDKLKPTLISLFHSNSFMKTFFEFTKCFYMKKEAREFKTFHTAINNYEQIIPNIDKTGWDMFVINLGCGRISLTKAIKVIDKAVNMTEPGQKYSYFGKFIALLFKSFAESA